MNHFGNTNVKVNSHSIGIKDIGKYTFMSTATALNSSVKEEIVRESALDVENSIERKLNMQKERAITNGINSRILLESMKLNKMNEMYRVGKETVFSEIIFEAFYNSLVLDEDAKAANTSSIRDFSNQYVKENGGYAMLEKAISKNKNNRILKTMKTVCESIAKEACNRKAEEIKETSDIDFVNFNLSPDDREQIRYNQELGIDQLSGIVKDKVKNVLTSEKNRQAEEEEIYNELQATEESTKALIHKNIVEETTLFNSMMRKVYKEVIQEKASTLKEAIDYDGDGDIGADDELDTVIDTDDELNFDMILAESISWYTLLEVMNTYQVQDFDVLSIKKIAHDNLYR